MKSETYLSALKAGVVEFSIPNSNTTSHQRCVQIANLLYLMDRTGVDLLPDENPKAIPGNLLENLVVSLETRGLFIPTKPMGKLSAVEQRNLETSFASLEEVPKKYKRSPHDQELWRRHMCLKYGIKYGR